MAGTQITNIATKQDLMCGANHLNVAYTGSGDAYTVSGMIECAGAWYRFVDEPVTVTTSDYIKVVPSTGTATLAAITSFSGVAFDTDKNGYYVTGTNERVFAYRNGTTTIFEITQRDVYVIDKLFTESIIFNLAESAEYIIPKGSWLISSNNSDETIISFYITSISNWRSYRGEGAVFSDGVNVKIFNFGPGSNEIRMLRCSP